MVLLCIVLLCGTVFAANEVTRLQSTSTVTADGACQVVMTVEVKIDQGVQGLVFPIPGDAVDVTLNGAAVRTGRSGDFQTVDLSGLYLGGSWEGTLSFRYVLPRTVTWDQEKNPTFTLPVLCGFALPVEKLDISVTFPGELTEAPAFTSGYHQQSIESSIAYSINGPQLTATTLKRLLDRETLTMTLQVPAEMFPATETVDPVREPLIPLAGAACALLAILYWVIFLRSAPLRRIHRTTPPEGITAGEVCSRLTGSGADLSLMVVTWAQLGYLYMDRDDVGRIFLRKRMDMGNERSAFENHCFRALFGKKRSVDGTGYHYAQLCRKIAGDKSAVRGTYRKSSGNPGLFRILSCGTGLCSGIYMGFALPVPMAWRIALAVILGVLGAVAAWLIQKGCRSAGLRDSVGGLVGLGSTAVWILASVLTGTTAFGVITVLFEMLAGFGAFFGGRRTDAARQTAGEILGLRRYMKTVSRQELQRILHANPGYYYQLAPYALALGVDKRFARRLGRLRLPGCPYLVTGISAPTAQEWYTQLREAVDTLDAGQKRMQRRRFFPG